MGNCGKFQCYMCGHYTENTDPLPGPKFGRYFCGWDEWHTGYAQLCGQRVTPETIGQLSKLNAREKGERVDN
jgi:hypothetical protein